MAEPLSAGVIGVTAAKAVVWGAGAALGGAAMNEAIKAVQESKKEPKKPKPSLKPKRA